MQTFWTPPRAVTRLIRKHTHQSFVRPKLLGKATRFLVHWAHGFGRKLILRDVRNVHRAIVAIQVVTTIGKTNRARRRIRIGDQRRRSLRRFEVSRLRPQTNLPFVLLKRRPFPLANVNVPRGQH